MVVSVSIISFAADVEAWQDIPIVVGSLSDYKDAKRRAEEIGGCFGVNKDGKYCAWTAEKCKNK